jgi:L-ascorbate metabolism protein UlaG (beta-lactamase superfamily)
MVISFYGEGCFKISTRGGSTKGGQSGDLVILTDPFESSSGLFPPRFKADIVLKTLTPLPIAQYSTLTTQRFISGPGEYDLKGVKIFGLGLRKESSDKYIKTAYLAEVENLKLCFLGHLSEAPQPEIAEQLEEIDILFIPAGGKPFISQEAAVKLIKQIEPKIAIPSFFKLPGLKRQASDLKNFLEEANHKGAEEKQEKLTIKKKDAAAIKKTEIVPLSV